MFGGIEAGLRLFGYGFATGFLLYQEEQDAYCGNPLFGWRFFPPAIARMPSPFSLPATKPPDTYRVLVLGSSAALGFPDPSLSFARILETMLREGFPDTRIEVINTAMVAINSHALVPIAKDCASTRPDLIIVYEGNNEVIGPYGPAMVLGGFSPRMSVIRAELLLQRTRLGQALYAMKNRFSADSDSLAVWQGMELFLENRITLNDTRMQAVYSHFADNLRSICDAAAGGGADVILCTVGVNLKDCPPFASEHRAALSEDELRNWRRLFDLGVAAESAGEHETALEKYRQASMIDDEYAELHYRMARCRMALHQHDEGRSNYGNARDLDSLRFRADSRLNHTIRDVAQPYDAELFDVEKLFYESSVDGIPGEDLFLEHVHMNFHGNYLIARGLFERIAPRLKTITKSDRQMTALSEQTCMTLLAYTDWDRYEISKNVLDLLSRPPFTGQLDHRLRLAGVRRKLSDSAKAMESHGLRQVANHYRRALERSPTDLFLRQKLSSVLALAGDFSGAAHELESVAKAWPLDIKTRLDWGGLLVATNRWKEAREVYGEIAKMPHCQTKCQADVAFNEGVLLEQLGDPRGAIARYQTAIRLKPDMVSAHGNSALLLAGQGDLDGAARHNRKVIDLAPEDFRGYLNLGLLYVQQNRFDRAVELLEQAAIRAPDNGQVLFALGQVQLKLLQVDSAVLTLGRAAQLMPKNGQVLATLGEALIRQGRTRDGIALCRRALELSPDLEAAKLILEAAEAAQSNRP